MAVNCCKFQNLINLTPFSPRARDRFFSFSLTREWLVADAEQLHDVDDEWEYVANEEDEDDDHQHDGQLHLLLLVSGQSDVAAVGPAHIQEHQKIHHGEACMSNYDI